jgi:hypothetical protein
MQEQVRKDLPQVQNPRPAENLAAFNGMTGEICKPILARFAGAGKAS